MKNDLLEKLRSGQELSRSEQLSLTLTLSIPTILAQLSTIAMQYIDASMVGRLGSDPSAAIGLVSSSTWLMNGVISAVNTGFTVQIAQLIGAGERKEARNVCKQGIAAALCSGLLMMIIGCLVSGSLPVWLGGDEAIWSMATWYFRIFALFVPFTQLTGLGSGILQCSGDMVTPSRLNILMCVEDVIFNFFLIFDTRTVTIAGWQLTVPGAGLGIVGAALGTAFSEVVTALLLMYFVLRRSEMMHLRKGEKFRLNVSQLKRAVQIGLPVGIEQTVSCSAYVMLTRIVAPLGSLCIAAHSFAVTAESLCYMPGYGIGSAATTLIGQSIGARRTDLVRRLGFLTTGLGMLLMTCTGILMYIFAPYMIGFLTPDPQVRELGIMALRITAFSEPLYAASIVANGVFRGAGDTLVPSCLNLVSMWFVRLPAAAFMATHYGFRGVWMAMCFELWVRGALFLIRLVRKKWK